MVNLSDSTSAVKMSISPCFKLMLVQSKSTEPAIKSGRHLFLNYPLKDDKEKFEENIKIPLKTIRYDW